MAAANGLTAAGLRFGVALLFLLTLGACATTDVYDPVPKFANLAQPAEEIAVTGSRIKREADVDDLNWDTLSPTSVITRAELDQSAETGGLYRFLLRRLPNMLRKMDGNGT